MAGRTEISLVFFISLTVGLGILNIVVSLLNWQLRSVNFSNFHSKLSVLSCEVSNLSSKLAAFGQ